MVDRVFNNSLNHCNCFISENSLYKIRSSFSMFCQRSADLHICLEINLNQGVVSSRRISLAHNTIHFLSEKINIQNVYLIQVFLNFNEVMQLYKNNRGCWSALLSIAMSSPNEAKPVQWAG